MNIVKELKKKGKNDYTIANLDITQEGEMTVRVAAGPVFFRGKDFTLDGHSDYVVDQDAAMRGLYIWLVKQVSDDKCVVFVDEVYKGGFPYLFSESPDYNPMFKLGEVRIPAGVTNLNDATLFVRRWIDRDELAAMEE